MKKILLILVFVMILLSACSHINSDQIETLDMTIFDYVGTFKNGDDLYVEAYRYYMQDAAWEMVLAKDGEIIKIFDGLPSRPKFNKDRTKILYVDELQFEVVGNVTIYDSTTDQVTQLTHYDYGPEQTTVKDVEWFTEDKILCIVGFSTGTISQGGDLYLYDLKGDQLKPLELESIISEWTDKAYEIADVYLADGVMELTLIEWTDDNFIDYYYTVHTLTSDQMSEVFD